MRRRSLSIFLIILLLMISLPQTAFSAVVLKTGSRGSEVVEMQQRLINLGYLNGKADGIFGPATEQAVRSFQSAHNLVVDGKAGPQTLNALYSSDAKPAGQSASTGGGSSGAPDNGSPNPATGTVPIQRVLRRGARGEDVAALQSRLNELKYNAGTADGIFGSLTENAVRNFQRDRGLAVDGIAGSQTINALFAGVSVPPANDPGIQNPPSTGGGSSNPITSTLRRGSKGSQVTALQNKLNALGYNCGPADGIFGQATYNAVVNFQKTNNLTADGIVGPATAAKLFSVESGSGSSPVQPPQAPDPAPVIPITNDLKGKIVIIDPGHGGKDPGACHGGLYEKDLTLDMGLKLRSMLERAGATVYMTRSDDRYVSLFYRSAFANKLVLDMEIEETNNKIAEAANSLSSNKAALSRLSIDKANLAAYLVALSQLTDVEYLQNNTSVQLALTNMSSLIQQIIDANEQETNEAMQKLAFIEERINNQNNQSVQMADRIAKAEEFRNGLGQQWKERIHLGTQPFNEAALAELDSIIDSVEEALLEVDEQGQILEQEIDILNSQISRDNSYLGELHRLLNGFRPYFNDPSLNSRTAIYNVVKNGAMNIASDDLQKVMDITREKYSDNIVFVSIHLNATNAPETSASGIYLFYRNNRPNNNYNADYYTNYNASARMKFATKLLQEANKTTNFSKKKTTLNIDDFSVLRENNVVSALVEVGFMNNSNDLALVAQPTFRENVAYGLFKGIMEYFK